MSSTAVEAAQAYFFELETVAFDGRKIALDAIQKALAGTGAKAIPAAYARLAGFPSPARLLAPIAAATGSNAEESAAAAAQADFVKRLLAASPAAGLLKVLHLARERGFSVGAISALPEETARELATKAGLGTAETLPILAAEPVDAVFPTTEVWVKAARLVGRPARAAVAAATSAAAAKAALGAGMKCVAVPDAFTSFQDFGGADLVVDSWGDYSPAEVLASATMASR
jgi:putative hydrolase of the HAD superfamily